MNDNLFWLCVQITYYMNNPATAHNILDAAIGAIHREAGLRLDVVARETPKDDNRIVGANIQIHHNGVRLTAEVKKWSAQLNVGAVINKIKNLAEPGLGLLIADYINPKMGARLKAADIQFLDTAGNAYINQQPVYIYIVGNKPQQEFAKKYQVKTGRAFQPAGMKVVFEFLKDGELVNASYREIADRAAVALGTVGWVVYDLITHGFLLEGFNENQRKLVEFDLLLDKWVEAYPYKLKGKREIGKFTTDDPYWWKTINTEKFNAEWGGEIAAAKYTNYLNPQHGLIYIDRAKMATFLQAARLRKVDPFIRHDTLIDLVEPFWKETNEEGRTKNAGLVHPIIAYADLIETGDPRNLDAAYKLREMFLR